MEDIMNLETNGFSIECFDDWVNICLKNDNHEHLSMNFSFNDFNTICTMMNTVNKVIKEDKDNECLNINHNYINDNYNNNKEDLNLNNNWIKNEENMIKEKRKDDKRMFMVMDKHRINF